VQAVVSEVAAMTATHAMSAVVGLSLGFFFSWAIALVTLGLVPVFAMAQIVAMKVAGANMGKQEELSQWETKLGTLVTETVVAHRTVAAYGLHTAVGDLIHAAAQEDGVMRKGNAQGIASGMGLFLNLSVTATINYIGAVMIDEGIVDFQDFIRSYIVVIFLGIGIAAASADATDQMEAKRGGQKLFGAIDRKSAIDTRQEGGKTLDNAAGIMEFKDV
jgi:ATP-binding cassette subfamily B (MDR/TAP) protein 1